LLFNDGINAEFDKRNSEMTVIVLINLDISVQISRVLLNTCKCVIHQLFDIINCTIKR